MVKISVIRRNSYLLRYGGSRRVKLLDTKKIRFELFLCIGNMNGEKLVLGNYSYILEKLTFLQNLVFLLVF